MDAIEGREVHEHDDGEGAGLVGVLAGCGPGEGAVDGGREGGREEFKEGVGVAAMFWLRRISAY